MKPETHRPWRKTLRAEAKREPHRRPGRSPELSPIRRGSTWVRRHLWMPDDERRAIYAERARPQSPFQTTGETR